MTNYINAAIEFQKDMFLIAASMVSATMKVQSRLLEQQMTLFRDMHDTRRMEDMSVKHVAPVPKKGQKEKSKRMGRKVSPCKGPDLMDHYGNRAHDVDVEHLR